jgi:hypothetical protein
MSGLEVAGVVLGSLPLVISALEHYSEGINTVRRYRRYKIELRSLILQINTESGIFINTLEQLLTGIVRIELMADYLSEPGGDKWQTVGKALENRLRGAYDVYLDNVRGMETSLKQMMEKLALAPDGKVRHETFSLATIHIKHSLSSQTQIPSSPSSSDSNSASKSRSTQEA